MTAQAKKEPCVLDSPTAKRQCAVAAENLPIEVKFSDGSSGTPTPTMADQLTCTLTYFRNSQIAPFSSLDTWAWEMCMDLATSIWVIPS